MTIQKVIEIIERKSSIPEEGESFDTISEAFDIAVEALKEIEQYRELGTIEFLTDMKSHYVEVLSDLRQYQNLGTVEEIKEILQIISEGQDNVDESGISKGLLYTLLEYAQYKKIGTVEECQKAKEDKWISCSEKLPQIGEKVLVCYGILNERNIAIAELREYKEEKYWNIKSPVIAWQQLPEPYTKEEEVDV